MLEGLSREIQWHFLTLPAKLTVLSEVPIKKFLLVAEIHTLEVGSGTQKISMWKRVGKVRKTHCNSKPRSLPNWKFVLFYQEQLGKGGPKIWWSYLIGSWRNTVPILSKLGSWNMIFSLFYIIIWQGYCGGRQNFSLRVTLGYVIARETSFEDSFSNPMVQAPTLSQNRTSREHFLTEWGQVFSKTRSDTATKSWDHLSLTVPGKMKQISSWEMIWAWSYNVFSSLFWPFFT